MKLQKFIREKHHIREKTISKFTVHNKKLHANQLHNERFFDWFDKEFDIEPIVQT